ncbi:MAG: hypothetical protein LC781_12710 [Actinobacteria bacterium]|nr:hypothetical protein [Actinomycetota bacterium]
MTDFVVYHNPDVMGYRAESVDRLAIVTDKSANGVDGHQIWVLTGEGRPRTYYLCGWFVADRVTPDPSLRFATMVTGSSGKMLPKRSWPILNDQEWFPSLRCSQDNFAFGLQPISDSDVIRGLKQLAAKV